MTNKFVGEEYPKNNNEKAQQQINTENSSEFPNDLRLIKAVVIFRHGDRTPTSSVDNSLERSYWNLQLPTHDLQQKIHKIFPITWKLLQVYPKFIEPSEKMAHFFQRYQYRTLTLDNMEQLPLDDIQKITEKKELVETLLLAPRDDKLAIFKKHKLRGQLTLTGFFQMQQFGLYLRQRYVEKFHLLPKISPSYNVSRADDEFNDDDGNQKFKLKDLIYVRSTSFPRTIQSAQNVLIGLFSSSASPWWMSLNRTLLPINILPPLQENMLPNYSNCRNLEVYHRIIYNKVEQYLNVIKENNNNNNQSLNNNNNDKNNNENSQSKTINNGDINQLSFASIISPLSEVNTSQSFSISELEKITRKIFKLGENDRIRWVEINEKLTCLLHHNLPMDSLVTPIYIDRVKRFTTWKFAQLYSHPKLCRLAIGSFVGEIVEKFNLAIFNNNFNQERSDHLFPKLEIFAGHDSTLIPLFCSFKIFNGNWPDYGASLIIELWESREAVDRENRYFIKFLVNEEENEITIPYSKFEELTSPLIPENYEIECTRQ